MAPLHLQPILTPALLHFLCSRATLPHVWYYVAGVTLSALNRPDDVPKVLAHAIGYGAGADREASATAEEQLRVARRMREALLKSAAIVGMPKVINAMLALKKSTPAHLLDEPSSPSPSGRLADAYDTPATAVLQRGQHFFERVYGKASKRIMGQMDGSGTPDLGLAARLLYGHLLSNEKILTAKETSFVAIAGLIPQDANPQLKGHLRGAIRCGATVDEVRAVRELVIRICEAAGMGKLASDTVGGWGWREEIAGV